MALLKELGEYRSKIMKALCSDQEIVNLITDYPYSTVPDRSLMYTKIFPYAYDPDLTTTTDTYICFRVYVPEVMNKTFKRMSICFYVFTHQSNVRTDHGLRCDLIAERIEELFNGSMDLGVGRLKLSGVTDINPAPKFHGLAIEYTVSEFNRPSNAKC